MPEHQQTQKSTESKTTQRQATPRIQVPSSHPMAIIQRARMNPKSLTHADVMQLQRTIGNQALIRLFSEIGLIPSTAKQAPPVQRQEIPEEEEPLQRKMVETVQRQEIPEEEEPLQGTFEKKPDQIACPSCFASPIVQRQEIPEEEEPLQGKFESIQRQEIPGEEEPRQTKKENNTGMPDNLKAGVESLSGIDISDVRVHYNSSKPAEVGALAYTQGTNIHVAPGQEKHLPHEAWHVVQQEQGRVQPTMQMKGNVPINDDKGLEYEADVMGAKALQMRNSKISAFEFPNHVQERMETVVATNAIVQGVFEATSFKELLSEQMEVQNNSPESHFDGGFTTVGFEHEFAQIQTGPLIGLTHVEIAESTNKMPFTGLGFSLETDADNALELVSPPFLVELISSTKAVPNPEHIARMDTMIKSRLAELVSEETTMQALTAGFESDPGIHFGLHQADVTSSNVNPTAELPEGERKATDVVKLPLLKIQDSKVKHSRKKGHVVGIGSQVNFATDASVYHDIKALRSADKPTELDKVFIDIQAQIEWIIQAQIKGMSEERFAKKDMTRNLDIFLKEMARTFSGHMARRSLREAERLKATIFSGEHLAKQEVNKLTRDKSKEKIIYDFHNGVRSHVKDVQGVWLKDTLTNFGLGLLTPKEWKMVEELVGDLATEGVIILKTPNTEFDKVEKKELNLNREDAECSIIDALMRLYIYIKGNKWSEDSDTKEMIHGPKRRIDFGKHKSKWLGLRQDTYIPRDRVKKPVSWDGGRLHVVEGRGDALKTLFELKITDIVRKHLEQTKIIMSLKQYGITPEILKQTYNTAEFLEILKQHGITPEILEKHGITSEILKQHGITSEILKQHGITSEILKQHGITPEILKKTYNTAEFLEQHGITSEILKQHGITPERLEEIRTLVENSHE